MDTRNGFIEKRRIRRRGAEACGHAHRFGSPSAGSGPRLYCTLARPFAAAGHDPGPNRGRLHVGGMGGGGEWWARWPDTFWLGKWSLSLQPHSSPPALSESFESHRLARAFVSGHPRPGQPQRGRPALPWRAAGRRIRVASEWREQ